MLRVQIAPRVQARPLAGLSACVAQSAEARRSGRRQCGFDSYRRHESSWRSRRARQSPKPKVAGSTPAEDPRSRGATGQRSGLRSRRLQVRLLPGARSSPYPNHPGFCPSSSNGDRIITLWVDGVGGHVRTRPAARRFRVSRARYRASAAEQDVAGDLLADLLGPAVHERGHERGQEHSASARYTSAGLLRALSGSGITRRRGVGPAGRRCPARAARR